MKKASTIFAVLREHLLSPKCSELFRINPSDFTRNRLLTCQLVILFILNLLKRSIPKEMISFSEYCNTQTVSRSAVTQARSKLSPQAFIYLNDILISEFYTDNDVKTFHGLIIMAIDGTNLELPLNSAEITAEYGCASNQTETQVPMAQASHLYDVINGISIDAIIAPYKSAERDLAIEHLEKLKKNWSAANLKRLLIIFDRGYPSAALIVYLLKNNINFLMRCNRKFMKEVDDVVAKGKKDVFVDFSAKRNGAAKAELKKLFPSLDLSDFFSIRVVIVTLKTGEKEILITSLLDKGKYPYRIFHALYFRRWGVEENYKFLKLALEIENFSGKSCIAVEQDFHATILAANARALLELEASNEILNYQETLPTKRTQKYLYEINKRVSMESIKNEFVAVLLDPGVNIEIFCTKVKMRMKRNLVPKRPGRLFRRIRKHPHRKFHMNSR
jgi:hypothetical protein